MLPSLGLAAFGLFKIAAAGDTEGKGRCVFGFPELGCSTISCSDHADCEEYQGIWSTSFSTCATSHDLPEACDGEGGELCYWETPCEFEGGGDAPPEVLRACAEEIDTCTAANGGQNCAVTECAEDVWDGFKGCVYNGACEADADGDCGMLLDMMKEEMHGEDEECVKVRHTDNQQCECITDSDCREVGACVEDPTCGDEDEWHSPSDSDSGSEDDEMLEALLAACANQIDTCERTLGFNCADENTDCDTAADEEFIGCVLDDACLDVEGECCSMMMVVFAYDEAHEEKMEGLKDACSDEIGYCAEEEGVDCTEDSSECSDDEQVAFKGCVYDYACSNAAEGECCTKLAMHMEEMDEKERMERLKDACFMEIDNCAVSEGVDCTEDSSACTNDEQVAFKGCVYTGACEAAADGECCTILSMHMEEKDEECVKVRHTDNQQCECITDSGCRENGACVEDPTCGDGDEWHSSSGDGESSSASDSSDTDDSEERMERLKAACSMEIDNCAVTEGVDCSEDSSACSDDENEAFKGCVYDDACENAADGRCCTMLTMYMDEMHEEEECVLVRHTDNQQCECITDSDCREVGACAEDPTCGDDDEWHSPSDSDSGSEDDEDDEMLNALRAACSGQIDTCERTLGVNCADEDTDCDSNDDEEFIGCVMDDACLDAEGECCTMMMEVFEDHKDDEHDEMMEELKEACAVEIDNCNDSEGVNCAEDSSACTEEEGGAFKECVYIDACEAAADGACCTMLTEMYMEKMDEECVYVRHTDNFQCECITDSQCREDFTGPACVEDPSCEAELICGVPVDTDVDQWTCLAWVTEQGCESELVMSFCEYYCCLNEIGMGV